MSNEYKPLPGDHYLRMLANELAGMNANLPEGEMLLYVKKVLKEAWRWAVERIEEIDHEHDGMA